MNLVLNERLVRDSLLAHSCIWLLSWKPLPAWVKNAGIGLLNYWGMASSLVSSGTLNRQALLDDSFSAEMVDGFCKVPAFLKALCKRSRKPAGLFGNIGLGYMDRSPASGWR